MILFSIFWSAHVTIQGVGIHPVRIADQLFFGGHIPCRDGQANGSMRVSRWEIYPVDAIDVCKMRRLSSGGSEDDPLYGAHRTNGGVNPKRTFAKRIRPASILRKCCCAGTDSRWRRDGTSIAKADQG